MTEFKDLCQKYVGKDFIVLGCGTSVSDFVDKIPNGAITIGVNDIGDVFTPDYLLVVNSPATFSPASRANAIFSNKSKYFITHIPDKWSGIESEIIKITLGNRKLTHIGDVQTNIIDYHNNSPFMACICAYNMGARRIGLIGVDFTNNHFNIKDGKHTLSNNIDDINSMYKKLSDKLLEFGCELYNLSPISNITSLKKMNQDKFIEEMVL